MNVYEFGKEHEDVILLIHPSVVKWDYFEYVIPLLEKKYHLIVPALPHLGHGGLVLLKPELFAEMADDL